MAGFAKKEHPAWKGIRSAFIGIMVNLLLSAIKFTAGYTGNSYALIADSIESLSDVVSSSVVLLALYIATRDPDQDHPYGHGKAEPIATAFIGISLFGAAILIIAQSIKQVYTPHEVPSMFTLWVLAGVILVKEILFRQVHAVGRDIRSSAVKSDAWHHRSDAITSGGAFIGIAIAIIGGKGYEGADDVAAILTSGIILYNAYSIIGPAIREIMDVAPPLELVEEVKTWASEVPGVMGLDKCYLRKMGLDYYVDIHVIVDGTISVQEGHRIAHLVKERLMQSTLRIRNVLVHIEPFDEDHIPQASTQ